MFSCFEPPDQKQRAFGINYQLSFVLVSDLFAVLSQRSVAPSAKEWRKAPLQIRPKIDSPKAAQPEVPARDLSHSL